MPTNGAIYSTPDILVSGVVKGKVTVATGATCLRRADTYNTNGVDVLGVEATGTVFVAQCAPDAGHNITIYSAMFALNGDFEAGSQLRAARPPARSTSTGRPRCTGMSGTKVWGNDISGSIVFSNMFSARFYNYDQNLLFVLPPYWPNLGNAYTILVAATDLAVPCS